jgi:hypothetical protein
MEDSSKSVQNKAKAETMDERIDVEPAGSDAARVTDSRKVESGQGNDDDQNQGMR